MLRRRNSGFTLIELLVVIAIIAIMAGILFPVMTQARRTAKTTKCLSNCKQIATALVMYKGDYGGNWPYCNYAISDPNPTIQSYGFAFWTWMLRGHVKSKNIYRCPLAARKFSNWADNATIMRDLPGGMNYGVNEYLVHSTFGNYHSDSELRNPSKTALIADCMCTLFHDWSDAVPTTGPDGITLPSGMLRVKYADSYDSQFNRGISRHNGEVVIFADLHAQTVRSEAFKFQQVGNVKYEYPIIHPLAQPAK